MTLRREGRPPPQDDGSVWTASAFSLPDSLGLRFAGFHGSSSYVYPKAQSRTGLVFWGRFKSSRLDFDLMSLQYFKRSTMAVLDDLRIRIDDPVYTAEPCYLSLTHDCHLCCRSGRRIRYYLWNKRPVLLRSLMHPWAVGASPHRTVRCAFYHCTPCSGCLSCDCGPW